VRLLEFLRESLAAAWASKVPSALVAVVVAATCFVALSTVGKTAANEEQIRLRLEAAGARLLSVTDTRESEFINPRTLGLIRGLTGVDVATGVGVARDVTNGRIGPGGTRVAAFPVDANLSQIGRLVRGRWARPGEALVTPDAQRRLGMVEPVGFVQSSDKTGYPVVGAIEMVSPFDDMARSIIINTTGAAQVRELRVVITSIADVNATQKAILSILAPADPQNVQIESPSGLADTAQDLGGQLAGFGRSLLLLILGVGACFVATVVLSDVLVRRRDLGRRRTLGATRADLTGLVVLRTTVPAITGATVGSALALALNASSGYPTPVNFGIAVATLASLAAALAAAPPAVYAAWRDPVNVMRTP